MFPYDRARDVRHLAGRGAWFDRVHVATANTPAVCLAVRGASAQSSLPLLRILYISNF